MIIRSIYPSFEDSAGFLPTGINIKLILRHSLRPTLQGVKKHYDVRLTDEGQIWQSISEKVLNTILASYIVVLFQDVFKPLNA